MGSQRGEGEEKGGGGMGSGEGERDLTTRLSFINSPL